MARDRLAHEATDAFTGPNHGRGQEAARHDGARRRFEIGMKRARAKAYRYDAEPVLLDAVNPTPGELSGPCELRVLTGPQTGARTPWRAATSLIIATQAEIPEVLPEQKPAQPAANTDKGADPDILLFGDAHAAVRIRVVLNDNDDTASVWVLQGQIQLAAQAFEAGAQTQWATYERLMMAGSCIAFGPAATTDWPDLPPIGARETYSRLAVPSGALQGDASPRNRDVSQARRAATWLGTVGAIVATICIAAFLLLTPPETDDAMPVPAVTPDIAKTLARSPYSALQAVRGSDGSTTIRGRLATHGDRAQLDAWLTAGELYPKIDVVIDETLAHDVAEVFRVNGVHAIVTVLGPGRIAAQVVELDPARLTRAGEAARRDVSGLSELAIENTAVAAPPSPPPTSNDPGKRIASLVPGSSGYLVTADGARYFVGAVLPSGHRVVKINEHDVTVEWQGQTTQLHF